MDIIFKSRLLDICMDEIRCPRCDNKMVDMQLSNNKLVDRGTRMIMDEISVTYEEANQLLAAHGSVRNAVDFYLNSK